MDGARPRRASIAGVGHDRAVRGTDDLLDLCGDTVQLFATSPMLALGIMLVSLAGGMALYVAGLPYDPHSAG